MSLFTLPALALFAFAPAAPGTEVKLELKSVPATMDRNALPPVGAGRVPVTVSDKAMAGAPKDPEGWTAVQRGMVELGGKKMSVAVGKKAADAASVDSAAVDLNVDGAYSGDEIVALTVRENKMKTETGTETVYSGSAPGFVLKQDAVELPFGLTMTSTSKGVSVAVSPRWYYAGTVKIGDVDHTIVFQDADADGKIDGKADRWGAVAAADLGKKMLSSMSMAALDEKLFLNKNSVGATLHGAEKADLSITAAAAPDPKDLEKARIRVGKDWAARFDKEREEFVAARKIDTKRPLAKDEIHWQYITFDAAQKLAKDSNKPLFVDVMAYWCVWCYRMDYYTYPDAEVANVLNTKYIPVKIIQEQDQVGDYEKVRGLLDAQGIPAMGIWTAGGSLVHKIGGWEKPEEFLGELSKGLELAAAKPAGN